MKSNFKTILFYLVIICVVVLIVGSVMSGISENDPKYTDIIELFNNLDDYYLSGNTEVNTVKTFELDENNFLVITTTNNKKIEFRIQDRNLFYTDCYEKVVALNAAIDEYNSKVAENNKVKEENENNKDNPELFSITA